MSLDALKDQIPDYAKDLRLNLSTIPSIASLTPQQLWGTVLAAGLATGNAAMIVQLYAAAAPHLSAEAVTAVKAANAIMGMNQYLLPLYPPGRERALRHDAGAAAYERDRQSRCRQSRFRVMVAGDFRG